MTRSLVLPLTAMVTFALAGCGGGGGQGSPSASKPPSAPSAAATPARRICKAAGIHYVGSTDQDRAVCFTLTPDGKRLREIGFDTAINCAGRGSSSGPLDKEFEGVLPELGAHGRIDQEVIAAVDRDGNPVFVYLFRGSIRGAAASGVLSNKGFCESLTLRWAAHRVSSSTAQTGGACIANGARWTTYGRSGTRYEIVRDERITCAFAKRWVALLSGKRLGSGELRIPGGPPGSSCIIIFDPRVTGWKVTRVTYPRAWAGWCSNTEKGGFSWGPHGLR